MTPADLARAGVALIGHSQWKRPLAALLRHPDRSAPGIDDRLVRRWAAGSRPIPPWVGPELRRLARVRGAALRELSRGSGCLRSSLDADRPPDRGGPVGPAPRLDELDEHG